MVQTNREGEVRLSAVFHSGKLFFSACFVWKKMEKKRLLIIGLETNINTSFLVMFPPIFLQFLIAWSLPIQLKYKKMEIFSEA